MSDDGFIGMPPGITPPASTDSGTIRRDRPERPRTTEREEIVFFPAVPGAPAAESEPAEQPADLPATQPFDRAELDEATRASLPRRHAAPVWRLEVGGLPVTVEGVLYLGRNPVATTAHPDAAVLAVDDQSKSVSKTHAMLEVDAGELWVHDLDSTNGVWVVPEEGEPIEVVAGRRQLVPSGAVLELGDYAMPVELR